MNPFNNSFQSSSFKACDKTSAWESFITVPFRHILQIPKHLLPVAVKTFLSEHVDQVQQQGKSIRFLGVCTCSVTFEIPLKDKRAYSILKATFLHADSLRELKYPVKALVVGCCDHARSVCIWESNPLLQQHARSCAILVVTAERSLKMIQYY